MTSVEIRLAVRVPGELVERLDREAERDQRTRSNLTRVALDEYLARAERKRHNERRKAAAAVSA